MMEAREAGGLETMGSCSEWGLCHAHQVSVTSSLESFDNANLRYLVLTERIIDRLVQVSYLNAFVTVID